MPDVILHIGAMKTGTSYIQQVFSANREALAEQGVLWPGADWSEQVTAVEKLMRLRKDPEAPRGEWRAFADQCAAYSGQRVVISMEFLSFGNETVAQEAIEAFAPHRVKVVLSLRDLARVLPAQWQELTQNGRDWTYRDYLEGATARKPTENKWGRHFWFRQDWLRTIEVWQKVVAPADLVLVTVPPTGAPPRLLMERMGQACEIDTGPLSSDVFGNDSLGSVSAELMRRVTHEALERALPGQAMKVLKYDLAKFALSRRRKQEPAIALPRKYHSWVERRSAQLVKELRALDLPVVGDLDELLPTWPDLAGRNVTDNPQATPVDDLLEAATTGLLALTRATVASRR